MESYNKYPTLRARIGRQQNLAAIKSAIEPVEVFLICPLEMRDCFNCVTTVFTLTHELATGEMEASIGRQTQELLSFMSKGRARSNRYTCSLDTDCLLGP